ncbi:uncharacterized protein LOC132732454, partial [Ruditapes philippinarum]|uniref:uncharacterized protein LOC132732454 n=1 Tax=Ruditapes philippinarum TaxID=129788 RepID=UPI00295C249E
MGGNQSVRTPQPTQKSDVKPASKSSETSTQTDDVVNEGASNEVTQPGTGADSAAVNTDTEPDSSVIPDAPPPYTRLGEEASDDTSVKRDLSSESKKSPPDGESLDDLKFAIEKSNIDFNERLASLEKSLQSNIEHQGETSKALMDLQDTVYTYFETRNEDVTTSRQGDDTRRREQFTERLGKHVVEHLLNSEVFKDVMQQGMGIGQIEEQQEKVLEHNKDNESITSQKDKPESGLLEDSTDLSKMKLVTSVDSIHKIPSDLASVNLDDFREVSFDENKPENPVICKDKKQKDFRIDSNVWKLFLNKVDKGYEAKQLLEMGILPDKYLLKKIGPALNLRSDIFQSICQCICQYIKTRSSKIVNVWTAFRYNKFDKHCGDEIIFVVITKEPEEAINIEYETYQRCLYEISDKCDKENSRIQLEENKHRLQRCTDRDLTKCLRNNAKTIDEKKHTNLDESNYKL